MPRYLFYNDYSEGAHPRLLDLLARGNLDQEDGYGNDALCLKAAELLKRELRNPGAAVHFVPGGTHANLIGLASMLRPHESVIAAHTAHINVHEAGAVEATGHKLNLVSAVDGKLAAAQIQEVVEAHTDEHMVKPRVVFISNSSEVGTVYRKSELEAIARVCRSSRLYLYMDGARLGSALTSRVSDMSMADVAGLVDMLYVGGTKNGALLGEAMVITNPELQPDFRFHLKQRGALLAKGRILGSQFLGLFQDGLYFELARHANRMAERMAIGLRDLGYEFFTPPETNQIFPVLPDGLIAELAKLYGFYVWARTGSCRSVVRLVTSWATAEDRVLEFLKDVARLRPS